MGSYFVGKRADAGARVCNEMSVCLPALSVNEGVARAVVAAFCAQADPQAGELADIKCALSEAVTNAIVHAYRETAGDVYIKAALLEGGWLRIEVRDKGCGIADPQKARETLYTTDREGERSGMGFTVMESFCDGVRISSTVGKGSRITLFKQLSCRPLHT